MIITYRVYHPPEHNSRGQDLHSAAFNSAFRSSCIRVTYEPIIVATISLDQQIQQLVKLLRSSRTDDTRRRRSASAVPRLV